MRLAGLGIAATALLVVLAVVVVSIMGVSQPDRKNRRDDVGATDGDRARIVVSVVDDGGRPVGGARVTLVGGAGVVADKGAPLVDVETAR